MHLTTILSLQRFLKIMSKVSPFTFKCKKSSTSSSIPAIILKQSIEIDLPFLPSSINYAIKSGEFSDK